MITITTSAQISPENPIMQVEGIPSGSYEVLIVLQPKTDISKQPRIGFSAAKFVMSDDFNEPIDDFKAYM